MTTLPVPPSTVTCPRCLGVLDPATDTAGWVTCGRCGHRAATEHVVGLLTVDAYLRGATAHRTWLLDRLTAGDGPTGHLNPSTGSMPAPMTSHRPGPPSTSPATQQSSPVPAQPSRATQTLLLTGGGILIAVAGLFFASVAWGALSGTGKVAVLLTVGALLAGGGYWGRVRVRAAAQSLTAVGAALIATATYGAPALGAVPDAVYGGHDLRWAAVASLVLGVVFGVGLVLTRLYAWVYATANAAAVAGLSLSLHVADLGDDPLLFTAVSAAVGVLAVVLGWSTRHSTVGASVRRWADPHLSVHLRYCWRALNGLLVGSSVVSLLSWFADQQERTLPYAAAAAGLGAVLLGLGRLAARPELQTAARLGGGALWGTALGLVLSGAFDGSLGAAATVVLPGTTGAALLVAASVAAPAVRDMGVGAAAAVWLSAVAISAATGAAVPQGAVAALFALTAVGLSASAACGRAGGWAMLAWPGGVSAVVAWCSWWHSRSSGDATPPDLAGAQDPASDPIELYTAPSALLLLAAGALWAWRRHAGTGAVPNSAQVLLPGLLMLVVPGASTTLDLSYLRLGDDGASTANLVRSVVYLLGAAVLVAVGARVRLSALVVAGSVGLTIATLGHVGAVDDVVPRWVTLAAAGALLLLTGVRWEWLRTRTGTARRWVGLLR